ncbi:MAG: hypothetical protein RQ826_14275 [Xanthomonadales bacterium]|nr:hypothetical protein [Xanthomonadales bacterium]
MKRTSEERRQARLRTEQRALATVEHLLGKVAPDLVAKRRGAGLSRDHCESLVQQVQSAIEPKHWKAARKHLRKRLKQLEAATAGSVYLPPPATYIQRDKSPLAGNAMTLVSELEVLIERFLIDVRENLNAPVHPVTIEREKNRKKSKKKGKEKSEEQKKAENRRAEKKKAEREHNHRLRTLGRIVFSAIANGGLLNQSLYRNFLAEVCDGLHAHGELAWVSFPLDDREPDDDGEPARPGSNFDAPVRRWILDPVTLGLVTRWRAANEAEERRAVLARTKVQNALRHYLKYLRRLPISGAELRSAAVTTPTELFRAATARTSLYLPPVLVNFLRHIGNGQSMSERTWWRYQFDLIVDTPNPEAEASDTTAGLATVERQKVQYKGDKAAFFRLQEGLLKVLQQNLGEPGNLKKADKNGPAVKRIEAVLEKRKADMAPLLYAFFSWILWKLKQPSKNQGRIRCSSARRYTSRLGQALIALGAELSIEGMGPSEWENFYDEIIESLDSAIDRTKAVGNLRDFHRFLMISFDAPPAAIDGEIDLTVRSRSALVSERDYQRLMEVLAAAGKPSHQLQVMRIIAMLMFRVGLRPNELIGLEYRHIQGAPLNRLAKGSAEPVLYMHATSREVLKTPSAVRQIPLTWFLKPEELEEFQAFLYRRLFVFRDSNRRNAVIFTPSLGVNTQISSKEFFGPLTDLLRDITGDSAVVAYTLRHGCLSNIFLDLLSPSTTRPHAFFRNDLLPREAIYAISTLAGHLDPDITLQSYVHTQDIACYSHLREHLKNLPIGVWAALEGREEASLHQRRARKKNRSRETSDGAQNEQLHDTTTRLIKQLGLSTPKAKSGHKVPLPEFETTEASLLDFDIETIHALLFSLFRNHSQEARARLFGLPDAQIQKFLEMCLRLASHRTVSTSGKLNPRNLKPLKPRKHLPELYRHAQPGQFGPAPPHHSREEMEEANRVFRLLARKAREMKMDRGRVIEEIIKPVRDLLLAHSGSEAIIRVVDRGRFVSAVQTLRSLNIPPERIELEIEALPVQGMPDLPSWFQRLCIIGKSRKLRQSDRSSDVTRRSEKYPDFGIVKVRVLERTGSHVAELNRKARGRVGSRAGVGWRVGCYYSIASLSAVLPSK